MLDVGFISDLHLGHMAIAKARGFDDIDKYNEEVIRRINKVCGKRTLLFLAGDSVFESKKYIPLLGEIEARIALIGGNHETRNLFSELCKYVESISGALEYKDGIITHIPIHPQEMIRFKFNAHGHTHENLVKKFIYTPREVTAREIVDNRYKNISWDRLEGTPISFEKMISL